MRSPQRSGTVVLPGLLGTVLALAGSAMADWPQFLGADRSGVATDAKGLPRSWPAGGPKVVWRTAVGKGFGGPAIHGDSVLLLDYGDGGRDVVRRIRLGDGKDVWRFAHEAPGKRDPEGSRSTPATDGELVFTVGALGHIHAVKFADGTPVWKAHLLRDWESRGTNLRLSQSPLLTKNALIVAPWGRVAAVVAYDKKNGNVLWRTPNPRNIQMGFSSPVPMTVDGRLTFVASGEGGHMIGVDAKTGKQLWSYEGFRCKYAVVSPTILTGGRIFLTGGYGAGAAMLKVRQLEDGFTVRELWRNKGLRSTMAQGLVCGDHIYGNSVDGRKGLTCITLDGEIKWQSNWRPDFEAGNLLIADGLIFIVHGSKGDLYMVEASPDGYKQLGRAAVLSGKKIWGAPAYSNGKLLWRDQTTLVCMDLKAR